MEKRFNFLGEELLGRSGNAFQYRVSITKVNTIIFPKDVTDTFELDGKFIKFFVDVTKKTIGWTIIEGKTDLQELNSVRKINVSKLNGTATFSIKKLLNAIKVNLGSCRRKIPVFQYKDILIGNDINYIELSDEIK